jgi:hypothetical protein
MTDRVKVIIYLFLIERVHIVRGGPKSRKKDKLYWIHLGGLAPYCVIVILAIIFRLSQLNSTGRCYIGLKRGSSFPLLIYDLFINVHTPLVCQKLNCAGIFNISIFDAPNRIVFI